MLHCNIIVNYASSKCGLYSTFTIDLLCKSHSAIVAFPTMHHFVTEMCTFLLQNGKLHLSNALWDLWDGSVGAALYTFLWHYIAVIMTTMASQITSLTVVYSIDFRAQIKENIKAPCHWPLCGEFTGTGEFPAQRASNAENVSIWWRHHDMIGCAMTGVCSWYNSCVMMLPNHSWWCHLVLCQNEIKKKYFHFCHILYLIST